MQALHHLQEPDRVAPPRHREELRLRERPARRIGGKHLSQVLGTQQDLALEDHPKDHVLVEPVAVDVEAIKAHQARQLLVRLGILRGFRLALDLPLHDVLLLLNLLILRVHPGESELLGIGLGEQIIVAVGPKPLDLVQGREVAQDDVRGPGRIRRPGDLEVLAAGGM